MSTLPGGLMNRGSLLLASAAVLAACASPSVPLHYPLLPLVARCVRG